MLPAGQGNDLWSIVWSSEDPSAREKRSYQKEFRQEPLSFPLKSLCISHGKKDRENWDGSTWRRGQRRDIIHVYKCLQGKCTKKNKKDLLQCCLVTWPETVCPNLNMWSFFWASWKNFFFVRMSTGTSGPERLWSLHPCRAPKVTQPWPWAKCVAQPL